MRSLGPSGQVLRLKIFKNPSKRLFLRSKLAVFKSKLHPEDGELWKIWTDDRKRKFLLVSEYRIRFFVAYAVLEIWADLWTPFLTFWPKMPTLRINNSRMGKDFDVQFFCKCSGTIWTTFWLSLIEFLIVDSEKKPKNPSKNHVFVLFGWSRFFMDNPALSLSSIYRYLTSCKVSRKSLQPFSRSGGNQLTNQHFQRRAQLEVENCNL